MIPLPSSASRAAILVAASLLGSACNVPMCDIDYHQTVVEPKRPGETIFTDGTPTCSVCPTTDDRFGAVKGCTLYEEYVQCAYENKVSGARTPTPAYAPPILGYCQHVCPDETLELRGCSIEANATTITTVRCTYGHRCPD